MGVRLSPSAKKIAERALTLTRGVQAKTPQQKSAPGRLLDWNDDECVPLQWLGGRH